MKTTTRTRIKIGLFTSLCLSTFILLHIPRVPKASEASISSSHLEKANQYYDSNDFEKAISAYQVAIHKDPACLEAYLSLGDCYYKQKDYEQAVAAFKKATAVDPKYTWPYVCLSQACFSAGKHTESIEALKKVEVLEPDFPGVYVLMGNSYVEMRQFENAVSMYQRTIEQDPSHSQAHFRLAKAYHIMGKTDSAFDEYEKLLKLDKDLAAELYNFITNNTFPANAGQTQSSNCDAEHNDEPIEHNELKTVTQQPVTEMQILDECGNVTLGGTIAAPMAPDSYIEDTLQSQMNAVQARFESQWNTIQDNAQYMGIDKANQMLQQITLQGKAEIARLQAEAQEKKDRIDRINMLRKQGALSAQFETTNVERLQWEIAAGSELASLMFPTPHKPQKLKDSTTHHDYSPRNSSLGNIQSIMQSSNGRCHILVDGRIYSEGDTVNTCKIVCIQEDGVKYEKAGKTLHQSLH